MISMQFYRKLFVPAALAISDYFYRGQGHVNVHFCFSSLFVSNRLVVNKLVKVDSVSSPQWARPCAPSRCTCVRALASVQSVITHTPGAFTPLICCCDEGWVWWTCGCWPAGCSMHVLCGITLTPGESTEAPGPLLSRRLLKVQWSWTWLYSTSKKSSLGFLLGHWHARCVPLYRLFRITLSVFICLCRINYSTFHPSLCQFPLPIFPPLPLSCLLLHIHFSPINTFLFCHSFSPMCFLTSSSQLHRFYCSLFFLLLSCDRGTVLPALFEFSIRDH